MYTQWNKCSIKYIVMAKTAVDEKKIQDILLEASDSDVPLKYLIDPNVIEDYIFKRYNCLWSVKISHNSTIIDSSVNHVIEYVFYTLRTSLVESDIRKLIYDQLDSIFRQKQAIK